MNKTHRPFELASPVSGGDHTIGSADAPLTLVEYGDFECPYCKQAAPAVKLLLARFENRIRFVYRHFPLEEVHPHARRAAEASECAGVQGKFWQMHDVLFDNQLRLQETHLRSYAERVELDVARYMVDMRDDVYLQRVREHQRSGAASGVRSTPGFFIDGRIHDASFSLHSLTEAIEAALRR